MASDSFVCGGDDAADDLVLDDGAANQPGWGTSGEDVQQKHDERKNNRYKSSDMNSGPQPRPQCWRARPQKTVPVNLDSTNATVRTIAARCQMSIRPLKHSMMFLGNVEKSSFMYQCHQPSLAAAISWSTKD